MRILVGFLSTLKKYEISCNRNNFILVGMKKPSKKWCPYILRCRDDSFYTGVTVDLKKRLESHNTGRGARYTRGRRPVRLVYFEDGLSERTARRREGEIKKMSRYKKELLISGFGSLDPT